MSLEYDFGPVPKPKDKYDDFETFTYYKEELLEIARDLIKERKELLERERTMMLKVNDLEHLLARLRFDNELLHAEVDIAYGKKRNERP